MPAGASGGARKKAASGSSKQRVSTPVLLQMHATECGAACLGSILGHFGRWVPLTELREKCEVSRDGSSAASIARAARHYGVECKGLSVRAGALKMLELPLILFWQFSHFVVLEGIDERRFHLNDPATGNARFPRKSSPGTTAELRYASSAAPIFSPAAGGPDCSVNWAPCSMEHGARSPGWLPADSC